MNILDEANKIVNERREEKERSYGSFSEGMKRAASIASGMTGKDISADDMFACMVALKFSRQSFNHKTDNLLDAVAYIGAWNNFIDEKGKTEEKKEREERFGMDYSETLRQYSEIINKDLKEFDKSREEHLFYKGEPGEEFKKEFEAEVFPPFPGVSRDSVSVDALSKDNLSMMSAAEAISNVIVQVNALTKYSEYLAKNVDEVINYSEYLATQMNDRNMKIDLAQKHTNDKRDAMGELLISIREEIRNTRNLIN